MRVAALLSLLILLPVSLYSQSNVSVSLLNALQQSESNYPALKSKSLEADAAKKDIAISKNTLLPNVDAIYQADLATYNNITGMTYPGSVFPITGPASATNSYQPVYGSAGSLSLAWQPYTFGQRNAQVSSSRTGANIKVAEYQNEVFKQKIAVINAYLDLVFADAVLSVYHENMSRVGSNLRQSRVLTISGLRPGVDTALFLSEYAKATIDLLNARKNLLSQKITLSELLVSDTAFIATDTFFIARLPSEKYKTTPVVHSLISLSQARIDYGYAKEDVLKKTWYPKLTLWGTTFARGSGIHQDGSINSTDGLSFSRYNYGVGLQVAFPLLKFSETRIQQAQQNLIVKSDIERAQQVKLQLSKQQETADATLQSALSIAKETPTQLMAARYAFKALEVRYNTGLMNFADLMQAQYNLIKAEIDLKKSYMDVWKALLYKTAVTGDLNIFLNELTQ
ncbi:MAG: TolC family protein [Flavipsychrobacter sp.]|nr:TolC family protein [Flavipsychrobacter sp.]